ncbi:DUF418 domain-containing protein [Erythrobacter cryptus]|uniref:DUF418 domain-containing protein n=1 Tax=Erythrobacter cryptus TaxID=196588 RepID=UPI00040DF174|nr:DUF418 domain-containing protein [Erythrobacter cryptus]
MTAPRPLPATLAPARIPALDALRGIAVAGIVAMNVHAFALPGPAYYNPLAYGGIGPADRWVWLVSFVFIEDKFRTLFAMLFGAGCLILLEKGAPHPWRAHYARMAVLFVIGLAHATLLASNDVLRAYALAGLAVPLLAGLSARALVTVAIGLVVVHVALGMVALGPALVDHLRHRIGSDALILAERQFGRDPMVITMLLEQGREGLAERALRRAGAIPAQLAVLIAALPLNLAAIALGMGLWKGGMLRGTWRLFWLQRLAAGCALVALPALLGLAAWLEVTGFPAALVGPVALVLSAPFDMALAVSYAALAMAFIKAERGLARRLAMAGRLSLSNYLLTSVILAALFAPWGLGLFGAVTRWQALALGAVPVAVMLAWSPWWAQRFGQGPLERLWRAAARRLT